MKQIKASEIEEYNIIQVDGENIVVDEVWADQGPGLGIMVIGKTVRDVKDWHHRFLNPDELVSKIVPAEQNDGS